MNLCIINGSPRKQKSNSTILTEHFLNGYRKKGDEATVSTGYLTGPGEMEKSHDLLSQASHVIIIFPLYTDCMPGIVKEFFEKLPVNESGKEKNLGFIVQSGFPEAIHSVYVERYLDKFSRRMGYNYLGTIIKGGVEGIQVMPPFMTRKLYDNFYKLGEYFAETKTFSEEIKQKLRTPLRLNKANQAGFRVMNFLGFTNFYWNSNLKKNGAFEKRFDKPLVDF